MTLPFVILNSSFGIFSSRLSTAQKTVERLTPATLAKAFRGELVPQDPSDEPASILLERLRSQPAAKPTRATRKPRK
jgi:type I restriction enzyme, S subunit